MRKSGLIAVLTIAALMSGCTENDMVVPDGGAGSGISFRLQSNLPATRTTGTTTDYVNAFVVNAKDQRDAVDFPDAVIFDAQTVYRVEGQANVFDYNPKKYYPNESSEAVYTAYSPVSKNILAGFKGSTENKITYNVLPPDGVYGTTQQEDLLVAYTKVMGEKQATGATPVDRKGFNNSVALNFKHALSRVYVKAANKNVEPVTITDISLNNLYNIGVLDLDDTKWNDADEVDINEPYNDQLSIDDIDEYKVLWNFDGQEQTASYEYVLPASGITVAANTANSPRMVVSREQGMMILPQFAKNANNDAEVNDGDFYLEVSYKLSNITNTVKATFNDILNISGAGGFTFEFGKQYALGIEFDGVAVRFEITVEPWNDEENVYAETTVVFAANKPTNASGTLTDMSKTVYTDFIDGEDLPVINTSNIPALTGWIFKGYWDEFEGGTQYYDENLNVITSIERNGKWDKPGPYHVLYAHWTANDGAIDIDMDSSSSDYPGINNASGQSAIAWVYDQYLPDLTLPFTSVGYDFVGLYTAVKSDGAAKEIYDEKGRNVAQQRYSDVSGTWNFNKLFAHWKAKTFTVTINLNGGMYDNSYTSPTFTQTYGEVANFASFSSMFTINDSAKEFKGFASSKEEADKDTLDVYNNSSGGNWQATYGPVSGNWTATDKPVTIWAVWANK